jgi:hypothetical protein
MKLTIDYTVTGVEADEDIQEREDEQRRWARFMHFCHTGRML